MRLYLGVDLGTLGAKAALVEGSGRVVATTSRPLVLDHPAPDRAEQDPEAWWAAVADATRELLSAADAGPEDVVGIGFAGQMLALTCLDAVGRPVRPAISWLDGRAEVEARRLARRLGGRRMSQLLAGAAPTGKDLIPKVWWLQAHEPAVFSRIAALSDATGFLVARATGHLVIDPTGAAATGMIDGRTRSWSRLLTTLAGWPTDRAPRIAECSEIVGPLLPEPAAALGLAAGTPVIAGLADIHAAAVGAGASSATDAHICLGTSSWLAATLDRPRHASAAGIVSVAAAGPGTFLMIGENETAGACLAWLAREIGTEAPGDFASLDALAAESPPGARGLLFAPWMFGERTPVPDSELRGAFVGLSLEHKRADVVRAVFDGIALNLAWTLDAGRAAGARIARLRVVGGGALSPTLVQGVADALGRAVEVVEAPQHAGAVGVALLAAVGTGELAGLDAVRRVVRVDREVRPRPEHTSRYAELGRVLREVQPSLSRASARLASLREGGSHR